MSRFDTVASLSPQIRAAYEAMPSNAIAMTVSSIAQATGYSDRDTRQHLATLCAKGLVSCNGMWCHRTRRRERRA